jgi:hypothetical protein
VWDNTTIRNGNQEEREGIPGLSSIGTFSVLQFYFINLGCCIIGIAHQFPVHKIIQFHNQHATLFDVIELWFTEAG